MSRDPGFPPLEFDYRVLIVDGALAPESRIRSALDHEGIEVRFAPAGRSALAAVSAWQPDLVICEVQCPSGADFRALRELRKSSNVPIMVVSVSRSEADAVLSLRLGADAFVTKPCGTPELVARIRAILRRNTPAIQRAVRAAPLLEFGDIEINAVRGTVKKNGCPVRLSPKETGLLLALVKRPGRIVSRRELLYEVWRRADDGTRTVDVHVAALREKLEDDARIPRRIITAQKVGYWWAMY